MKKVISLMVAVLLCSVILAGCTCEHQWQEASCSAPKTCSLCGEESGESLPHTWIEATCASPKTCTVCGQTSGEPLAHTYVDEVIEPSEFEEGYTLHTCSACNHSYTDARVPALGYYIMEGDLIFKPDGIAYLYGSGGVKETFTGWMTEVYKIEDDYEINAGGFLVTSPWFCRDDIYRVIIEDGVSPKSTDYWFYACYEMRSIHIGSDVTTLGEAMLAECSSLTQLTFSANSKLTTIENGAFGSITLSSQFVIPSGVTHLGSLPITHQTPVLNEGLISIGEYTLHGSGIALPSTVTQIGKGNFAYLTIPADHPHFKAVDNCLIQTDTKTLVDVMEGFTLPADGSITAIGDSVFAHMQLQSLEIPEGVTQIGRGAFQGSRIDSILLPDSVTDIGSEAFITSHMKQLRLPAGLTQIPDEAFYGCWALTQIDIPDSVTAIGTNAFCGCTSLESIRLPDSLKSIGSGAFMDCSALTSLEIPAGVTQIGDSLFYLCSSLESITVHEDNPEYYMDGNCLIGRSSKTLICGLGDARIPQDGSIQIIAPYAFCYNDSVTDLVIPEGVTSIGSGAFMCCSGITEFDLPEGITTIEDNAFYGCHELTRLVLPLSVKTIGDTCFDDCPLLVYVEYPGTLQQWRQVALGSYQCMSGENIYQIKCTDGIISPWG